MMRRAILAVLAASPHDGAWVSTEEGAYGSDASRPRASS